MSHTLFEGWFDNRFVNRIVHKALFGLAMLFCLGWSALAAMESGASVSASAVEQGQTMCTFERLVDVKKRTFTDTAS
ncbi:hypothetical protein BH10PSE18_BH10PSE18_25020 [soil metagenome]